MFVHEELRAPEAIEAGFEVEKASVFWEGVEVNTTEPTSGSLAVVSDTESICIGSFSGPGLYTNSLFSVQFGSFGASVTVNN